MQVLRHVDPEKRNNHRAAPVDEHDKRQHPGRAGEPPVGIKVELKELFEHETGFRFQVPSFRLGFPHLKLET